jgi:hypothetical protein
MEKTVWGGTDGDQHQRQQTMRANHAVFDPIFIQYIIMTGTHLFY